MFESAMVEKETNRVKIDDIDSDVMNEVLRFMYTGKTIGIENTPDLILFVADKVCIFHFNSNQSQFTNLLLIKVRFETLESIM